MISILSVDLEDYFMVSAFEGVVKREDWVRCESRIERNTRRILEMLNEYKPENLKYVVKDNTEDRSHQRNGVKATFFCLGWVGERYPRINSRNICGRARNRLPRL